MWTMWGDFDRTFGVLDELRRRMDVAFDDVGSGRAESRSIPRVNLFDTGDAFVLETDLPGFDAAALEITASQSTLTLSGARKEVAPEGYAVQRQERSATRFSRSFSFPCHIDPEKVAARLTDGTLSLTVGKAADAKPRRITVNAG